MLDAIAYGGLGAIGISFLLVYVYALWKDEEAIKRAMRKRGETGCSGR